MLGVNWTESALKDADTIVEYFMAQNASRALMEEFLAYLLSLSKRFALLPGMGALGKVQGTREYKDARSRCRLVYEVSRMHITVLRILHEEVGFADHDTFVAMTLISILPVQK